MKECFCLLGYILYNTTLRFFWANISCSFTKLLVLLRLNFWLKFWLKLFGVVNLYILLSLFLINASTDLAQIFRGPSLCYVSYVCYVCHVIFSWTTPPKQQKAAHVLKLITPKPLKGLSWNFMGMFLRIPKFELST